MLCNAIFKKNVVRSTTIFWIKVGNKYDFVAVWQLKQNDIVSSTLHAPVMCCL